MKTRILLVRHGATTLSAEDRFAGSSDVDLSEEGRALARRLADRLARVKIDACYCSDMKRTTQTATIIAQPHGRSPVGVPGLREIDHGKWERMIHRDVEKQYPSEYAAWSADPFNVAPPGGETGSHVLARAMPALLEIVAAQSGRTVLVVSHKATNRLLLCGLLGVDPREYRNRLAQDLACLNVLQFNDPTHAEVEVLNDTSHCAPLA